MSNPKKEGTRISIKILDTLLEQLDKYAAEENMTRTAAIEKLVAQGLSDNAQKRQLERYKEILEHDIVYDAGRWVAMVKEGALYIQDKCEKKRLDGRKYRLTIDPRNGYYYFDEGSGPIYVDFEKRAFFRYQPGSDGGKKIRYFDTL